MQVSPEATRSLTPQAENRGRLMPLHVASVLEWLCGDPNVQAQLGGGWKLRRKQRGSRQEIALALDRAFCDGPHFRADPR